MGGLFGSIKIPGNRLTDLVGQTSTVGRPIPFGYARCRITEPNVIWTAGIPKETVRRKKQGKGGVKTEEYTYTLSYAIAFMAGPTYGYLTIKRGGKVVFTTDPNSPVEDQAFAAKWLQKAKLYYGTEDQLPDPTIESYKGAGQVSAHRGLAYIVLTDDDVTAEGGSIPQYEAVIVASPPDIYLTSRPYHVSTTEALGSGMVMPPGYSLQFPVENLDVWMEFPDGQLKSVLTIYDIPHESLDVSMSFPDGELKSVLLNYNSWTPEGFDVSMSFPDGTLINTLISYTNWPHESLNVSMSFPDGTLS